MKIDGKVHCFFEQSGTFKNEFIKMGVPAEDYDIQVARERGLRLVLENPWSLQTFLKSGFIQHPSIIDEDRTLRGDYFVKPTAYWFFNCEPTQGASFQAPKERKRLMWEKKSPQAGICSEDRSMISPDYARNFICDFILGVKQRHIEQKTINQTLF